MEVFISCQLSFEDTRCVRNQPHSENPPAAILRRRRPHPPLLREGRSGGGAATAQARSGGGRAREAAHVRAGGSGRWRRPLVRPLGAMASILDEYEDSLHRSAAVQQSRAAVGIPHSGKRLSAARTDGRAPVRHVRRRGASGRGVSLKGRVPRGAVWWVSVAGGVPTASPRCSTARSGLGELSEATSTASSFLIFSLCQGTQLLQPQWLCRQLYLHGVGFLYWRNFLKVSLFGVIWGVQSV